MSVGLACAVCLFTREGTASRAVTILGGTALCEAHLGYIGDERLNTAITVIAHEGTPVRRS
jgi:hypothetical protein